MPENLGTECQLPAGLNKDFNRLPKAVIMTTCFQNTLSKVVSWMQDCGIWQKMKNDARLVYGSNTPSIPANLRNLTRMIGTLKTDENRPLTQDNFRLVYMGIALGCTLSLFCFLVELCMILFRQSKRVDDA